VARTIVEYAKAGNTDLIVMGTHGRTGLAHVFIGSVAERVVRTAPCPVLTIGGASVTHDAHAAA
jgi:nucleotide-binding universal stress UspA family protein